MRFLRDQAMQGAGFFLAVLVMLLQLPEHIVWLLPLSILFIVLLYVGHKFSNETDAIPSNKNIGWSDIGHNAINFSKRWVTPSITILIIFVSAFFTFQGIYSKTNSGVVERVEFQVTDETKFLNLHTIIKKEVLRNTLREVNPEIVFTPDNNAGFTLQIELNDKSAEFNDSGIDPQNIILEPNGNYQSSVEYFDGDEYPKSFDFEPRHTFFIKMSDGGLIRIYLMQSPEYPTIYYHGDYLILIVSYVSRESQRFDGLTFP